MSQRLSVSVLQSLGSGVSACLCFAADVPTKDIAGVPGTGKTATVHAVVKELKRKAEDGVSASRPASPVAYPWR